jgi:membrane protease YdiL (CAAX protease family)
MRPDQGGLRRALGIPLLLVLLAWLLVLGEHPDLRSTWHRPAVRFGLGLLFPVAMALVVLRHPRELGLGLGNLRRGGLVLGVGLPLTLLAMVFLVRSQAVVAYYGRQAGSPVGLAASYLPEVLQVEVLFRGLLVFPLLGTQGALRAAALAALPYGLIHLDKPTPEAFGSVAVGLGLGLAAAWSGSIWYGAVLHLVGAVALTLLASY